MNVKPAKPNHLSPFARNRITLITNIFVFGLIMGSLMAVFANIFVSTVALISSYRASVRLFTVELNGVSLNYLPILTLLIAASIIIIIKSYFQINRWNGPADAIYAAHRTDNELDTKAGYFSTLVALISASGGASVGQYGPLVHLGATIGTSLKSLTKDLLSTDVFLGCGVAGAISAGFGAPLAGIILLTRLFCVIFQCVHSHQSQLPASLQALQQKRFLINPRFFKLITKFQSWQIYFQRRYFVVLYLR